MAQCKQNAQEYIQDVFSPMVAVLCSHDAEVVCQRNNLTFVELVQPFCRLNSEATIRDSGNMTHTIRNLKISVRDMNAHPPQPTLAKKLMNQAVCNALPAGDSSACRTNIMSVGDYDLQISGSTPWFEAYRECFSAVAYPSDHEFIRHYLACLFVVSSSHADPMEQFNKLTQQQHLQQHQQPNKLPKWFCPNILRYYVLLHDVVSEHNTKAEGVYQSMKNTYGMNNCHMLQINSRPQGTEAPRADTAGADSTENGGASLPDPWSQFLPKKSDIMDGDFDAASVPSMEGELSFPSQLSEGANSLPSQQHHHQQNNIVDSAMEVTEENDTTSDVVDGNVINHPLAHDADTVMGNSLIPSPTSSMGNSTEKHGYQTHKRSKSGGHGGCLTLSDHDRLRIFVQEFVVRGLIPWAERMLRTLNEQVVTRRGIHRSLFSATKKWFGGNKSTPTSSSSSMTSSMSVSSSSSPSSSITNNAAEKSNVIYTPEAPEMQQRRLADLAFVFQMYETAYQTYHACKRDFNNDRAWLHTAGSLEMAGMSVYMQGNTSQRQYPHHYMESAITTYLNTCRNPLFATRATLLSTEALKSKNMYEEAAMQFIKMTSEDSDLRSALLLEQASHCFIRMKQPMVRKYAFHMILAGHRFSKAGQRRHALRAYQQALQVYKGKLWSLAEDHINFTIGRQSFNLKQLDNAAAAFKHLLTADSKQSTPQQLAFLREYLFVYKQLSGAPSGGELPQLPLPLTDGNAIKVLCAKKQQQPKDPSLMPASSVSFDDDETHNAAWLKLEQLVMVSNEGSIPANFRPCVQCATNQTNNSANPPAVVEEPVTVQVTVTNPLRIPLVLTDVCLLWRFVASSSLDPDVIPDRPPQVLSNETGAGGADTSKMATETVTTESILMVTLEGTETKKLELKMVPHQTGELHITGLGYNLGTSAAQSSTPPATTAITEGGGELGSVDNNKTGADSTAAISVRGKINLEVQGPRLNSTKEEKAAKMYGPDRRLDLMVVPAMPLLEVSFQNFPRRLLCGEVRQLSVQFCNTGSFPLRNLKVASTHPDFFTFCSSKQTGDKESTPTVYQSVPNSTAVADSEHIVTETAIKYVVPLSVTEIAPGESVQLPMWLFGPSSTGQHSIKFLFYYELADKSSTTSSSSSRPRHRVVRHCASVNVLPSLLLKASARRSAGCNTCHNNNMAADRAAGTGEKDSRLSVALEVHNRNTVSDSSITEFHILQVSCASQHWSLQHLTDNNTDNKDIKVGIGESTMMCLRATRCRRRTEKDNQYVFTNVPLAKDQICSWSTPCCDFYTRTKLSSHFETINVEPPKPALMPDEKPPDPNRDQLTPRLQEAVQAELSLIVIWKACVIEDGKKMAITGQHHVSLQKINEPITTPYIPKVSLEPQTLQIIKPPPEPEETVSLDPTVTSQLMQYTLHYTQNLKHDFSAQRLCQTSVVLSLHNCCDATLTVDLATSHLPSGASPNASSELSSSLLVGCLWSGQNITQTELKPGDKQCVDLKVCFVRPGVYNLASLQILATIPNTASDRILQKPQSPSLIIVRNSVET